MNIIEKFKSVFLKGAKNIVAIKNFIIVNDSHYIEVNFKKKKLKFKNYLKPFDINALSMPKEFFDEFIINIDNEKIEQIKYKFQRCLDVLPFSDHFNLLPPGETHCVYLEYKFLGREHIFSTANISIDSFDKYNSMLKPFTELYDLLMPLCDFPICDSEPIKSDYEPLPEELTPEYSEETLWLCEKCGTGNLMKNKKCIRCGEIRKF